jgi:hypothetical protein
VEQRRQQRKGKTGAYAPIKPAAVPDPKRSPVIASISKGRHRPCKPATKLDRLRNALTVIADLILRDATYVPIFIRLEEEIALEEAKSQSDALARARAMICQSALQDAAA